MSLLWNFSLPLLSLLFLTVSGCTLSTGDKTISKLNPMDFSRKMESVGSKQVIDVRTPEEYRDGHLPKSININFYNDNFKDLVGKLDRNRPVFVYCKVGGRSASAAQILEAMGFQEIYDLEGGFDKWKASGFLTIN